MSKKEMEAEELEPKTEEEAQAEPAADPKDEEIAKLKMPDLNAASVEAAMAMIAGTARSMGVTVEE